VTEATACQGNADCVALNTCIGMCADQACANACAMKSPNGIADFNALVDCTFGDGTTTVGACGTACSGPSPACTDGGTNYGAASKATCTTCQNTEFAAGGCCATEATTCGGNADCVALNTCISMCADQACANTCATKSPNGIADFNALVTCAFGDGTTTFGSCGTVCQ
jgi:hypothetical protein